MNSRESLVQSVGHIFSYCNLFEDSAIMWPKIGRRHSMIMLLLRAFSCLLKLQTLTFVVWKVKSVPTELCLEHSTGQDFLHIYPRKTIFLDHEREETLLAGCLFCKF